MGGSREWEITDQANYDAYCADVDGMTNCGRPCGYFTMPLGQEILTYGGNAQFDPRGPEGRALETSVSATILDFEGDRLVIYSEQVQMFHLNEKPMEHGPPSYAGE